MKNIKIKENKGITLISLVVTIILMIILAGISIVLLFGEQGIITRAKEQKIMQTKAEILDQLELQKTDVLNYDESLYTDLTEYLKHIDGKYLGAYKVTEIIEKEYENGVLVNAKIVVDGKYIYTAAQIENNVVINAVGYIEELDPQIDSFVVTNKTTKTITVEAKVRRAEKYEFYILKDGDWKKVETKTTGNMSTNEQNKITYTYEKLTSLGEEEKYEFKIVAIRGKREVEKIIDSEIKNVEIAEGNLIFDIQPTEWTNKEITTKIYKKTDEEGNILKELENLTIQYQINGTEETLTNNSKWIEYKEPIVTDKNIEIWVRLWDGINAGSATTRTITKIDKLAPTGSISVQTTTNSAKVTVSAQDRNATTEDGKSGIKGYYYSKDGGKTYTNITTETSYTFTNLTQSTSLNLKVKVEDNAGNVTEITESGESSSTLKVADLSIAVTDPNTWSKTTKTITITPSDSNYSKIRYTLDGSTPTTSSTEYTGAFTVNKNCTITAIALDSTNQIGSAATNTVSKIDKLAPTGSISVQTTTNSAKVTVSAQDRNATTEDGQSGIKGYYYSKDGGNTYTNITAETTYTFTNLTQSTSLDLKVKVEDNAENVTEITESGETSSTLKVAELTITVSDSNIWTKTKTVTITPKDNNYSKIRYTLNGNTPTTSSIEYTGAFTVNKNCTITAIALDSTNQIGSAATNTVSKIDKLAPNEFTPEITERKTRSLTVKATVDDAEATEEDGKSGLADAAYRFSKDGGSTWTEYQTGNSYKFDNLTQTTEYTIKVEVKDKVGNTRVGVIKKDTDTIPAGNFTFTKNTNNWTNGNVTVTVGTSITGYTLQTCKDGVSWANTNQQTLTTNGTVYARLTDGVNVNAVGTGPVTNIDKAAPTIGSASGSTATANSGTVSVSSISDTGGSGLKGIYISTSSSTPTATSVTWSGNTASSYSRGVSSNATYYIWVLDNAGNVSAAKSAKVSGIVSKVNITGYSNASVIVPNTVTPTLSYSGTPKSKSFSSSDTSVATVNSNGVVTGRHVGKATITATLTNYDGTTVSKSCTVSVSEYLTRGTTKGLSVGGDWINLQTVDTANSGSGVMSYGPEGGDHIGLWNCGYFLFQSWRSYNMYDFTNAKTLTADILYDTDSPTPVAATCIVGLVNTPSKVNINHDGTGFDIQTGFYKEFTSWHRETWNMDVSNCNGGYFLKFFLYKGTYGNNYTVGFKIYSILVSP